jgi:hypothetical protein
MPRPDKRTCSSAAKDGLEDIATSFRNRDIEDVCYYHDVRRSPIWTTGSIYNSNLN